MKILIEMREKDYNNIKPFLNGETIKGGFNLFNVLRIIKDGTPLKTGHWDLVESYENGSKKYVCSSCNERYVYTWGYERASVEYPFCNCGADMRGGNEE